MSLRRPLRISAALGRFGVTCFTLVGLIAGTIGFAVPPLRAIGGAFPCQGNGCGCRTAEDCWFGCCCLSPVQRLAWAKRNGVTPPRQFVRLAETSQSPKGTDVASCCGKKSRDAATCTDHRVSARCCSSAGQCQKATKGLKRSKSDEESPRVTTNGCGGGGFDWVTGGQPLSLPDRPITLPLLEPNFSVIVSSADYSLDPNSLLTRPG